MLVAAPASDSSDVFFSCAWLLRGGRGSAWCRNVPFLLQGEELKEHVGEEYVPWVSQYLVMKRASIEPNFHTLYSSFIDVLNIFQLTSMVVKETFRNIKVLFDQICFL